MIESGLKNHGHSVRVVVAPAIELLQELVTERRFLTIIVDLTFPNLRLRQFMRDLQKATPAESTVLAWTDGLDPTVLREVMDAGAHGLLNRSDSQLSLLQLERELRMGQLRIRYDALREQLGETGATQDDALDEDSEAIVVLIDGIVVNCNEAAAEAIAEGDRDELLSMPVLDLLQSDSSAALRSAMRQVLKGKGESRVDVMMEWATPGEPAILMTVSAVPHAEGTAIELRAKAAPAPGNSAEARENLSDWLRKESAQTSPLSVLMIFSLDETDRITDEVGLLGLEQLRDGLHTVLRSAPLAEVRSAFLDNSRIALGCGTQSMEDIESWVSGRLRQISRSIFDVGDLQVSVTASAAVYPLGQPPRRPDDILREALDALSKAQREGPVSRLVLVGDAADELNRREADSATASLVREALQGNGFELAFQSIACLTGDEREHVDVLLRLNDASGEAISPGRFISAAQSHGLMPAIDRWVISAALTRLRAQANDGHKSVFFVRLDIASVQNAEELMEWLSPLWLESGLDAGSMVIIIRERMLQTQLRNAMKLLNALRQIQIGTAIDHFGISTRSPDLLERLPVDYVKLHSDFTTAITDGSRDMGAFEQILHVAKEKKIHTIADRVTSANDMARLWQLGVSFLIGNHVQQPAKEITESRFRLSKVE